HKCCLWRQAHLYYLFYSIGSMLRLPQKPQSRSLQLKCAGQSSSFCCIFPSLLLFVSLLQPIISPGIYKMNKNAAKNETNEKEGNQNYAQTQKKYRRKKSDQRKPDRIKKKA